MTNLFNYLGIALAVGTVLCITYVVIIGKEARSEDRGIDFITVLFIMLLSVSSAYAISAKESHELMIKDFLKGEVIVVDDKAISNKNGWVLAQENKYFIKGDMAIALPLGSIYK